MGGSQVPPISDTVHWFYTRTEPRSVTWLFDLLVKNVMISAKLYNDTLNENVGGLWMDSARALVYFQLFFICFRRERILKINSKNAGIWI